MISQYLSTLHAVKENSSSAAAPASQLKRSTTDLCVYGICLLVGKFPVASAFIYVQEFYSFVTPHRISKAVLIWKQSEILDSFLSVRRALLVSFCAFIYV